MHGYSRQIIYIHRTATKEEHKAWQRNVSVLIRSHSIAFIDDAARRREHRTTRLHDREFDSADDENEIDFDDNGDDTNEIVDSDEDAVDGGNTWDTTDDADDKRVDDDDDDDDNDDNDKNDYESKYDDLSDANSDGVDA